MFEPRNLTLEMAATEVSQFAARERKSAEVICDIWLYGMALARAIPGPIRDKLATQKHAPSRRHATGIDPDLPWDLQTPAQQAAQIDAQLAEFVDHARAHDLTGDELVGVFNIGLNTLKGAA